MVPAAFLGLNTVQQEADMATKSYNEASFSITKHAQTRMQQRSFSEADISIIARCGTVITDQEILLTNKDVQHEVCLIRSEIKSLVRRIKHSRVASCGTQLAEKQSALCTEIYDLRQQITQLERLRNCKIVINGNRVVTCYHCSPSELKRISRIIN